jgi:hypothetical protein
MIYTIKMASSDIMYITSFMTVGSRLSNNIKVITLTVGEAAVLVLPMRGIYELHG